MRGTRLNTGFPRILAVKDGIMFSNFIMDIIDDEGIGSCIYVVVNVLIIGILKSIACYFYNGSGAMELLFFPFIIAAGIMTVIAFKKLINGDVSYMEFGGILSKFAVLYFIVSIVSIVV